tara:strand:- start:1301 stop:1918 length:618 start_codon:yes stop_codon:yes gene_type:complete
MELIMKDKLLLTEYYELCPNGKCDDLLTEEEKRMVREEGAMFLTGVMQRCNHRNGNGRMYSEQILRREVDNYSKLVRERRALGELDHPDSGVINLANASHLVTEIWWDGDAVMGKVQILNTPAGQILRSLCGDNIKLGISSRGMGSVHEANGTTIVEEDFQLICFDFVSEPSTTGAFMMQENKQPNIVTKADKINRALNDVLRKK